MLLGDGLEEGIDPEEYLFEKKNSLDHFFMKVYEELSAQPYALYFYLLFHKELIMHQESFSQIMEDCLELMRRTLKNIRDQDIEMYLFFNMEIAIQFVNDLIDEP